jgi:hypothetical protein
MIIFVDIDGTICQNRDHLRRDRNDPTISYDQVEPYQIELKK